MSCSNCYNGCTEIVSDKCVKYTGIDIPVLGIQNGDSLSYVEQALIEFLTSTLDGSGIKPNIDPEIICSVVLQYLPTCGELSANDLFVALIKATCEIQDKIVEFTVAFEDLNSTYITDCFEVAGSSSNTHDVLQSVIYALCDLKVDVAALALDLDTNYVKIADINSLIQAYLDSQSVSTKYYTKMVPYTVVEYYGSLSNFDASGAGIGNWEQIYLCNGNNGTPDKRGRSPIGAIQGVGGGSLNPVVDPVFPGNANYALGSVAGANTVTLTTLQLPAHVHNNVLAFNDPGHEHLLFNNVLLNNAPDVLSTNFSTFRGQGAGDLSYRIQGGVNAPNVGRSNSKTTGITATLTNAEQGGGQSHNNVHPVLACYYIMYIPS